MSQQFVADEIANFTAECGSADGGIFDNFDPQLCSVWNET